MWHFMGITCNTMEGHVLGMPREPWAVLEIEALKRAIARWERKEDYVKDV